ncbi:leucine-rich repeat neuronal protein 1-like [Bradysia coprophila]|uniref:leucine-rich repeat neuronal protein 1-like n=1 Tax=Bradysia coprophila TaxID=38358 RepID=UPI00187DD0F1|nr:leucine-rich repeat neuronal protein 1-like [Bradysia coprophila]
MVLKTLILLVSALSFSSSQQMTCTYSINTAYFDKPYQCTLNVNNPDGLDDAISIGGTHLGTSIMDQYGNLVSTYNNDSSVQIVKVVGVTKNIPTAICRQFPNIRELDLTDTSLQILSATKCSKLISLTVWYNQIEESVVDLCQYQPALQQITMSFNKIYILSDVTLRSCKNLLRFQVAINQIPTISSTFFANTPIIQSIAIGENPITVIPNGLFNGLSKLLFLYINNLLITDLPLNIFADTNQLKGLNMQNNKLMTITSKWFTSATLQSITDINLDGSDVNAIDPVFFTLATNLYTFSLLNNKCYNGKITDFVAKRSSYMPGFQVCINNFTA